MSPSHSDDRAVGVFEVHVVAAPGARAGVEQPSAEGNGERDEPVDVARIIDPQTDVFDAANEAIRLTVRGWSRLTQHKGILSARCLQQHDTVLASEHDLEAEHVGIERRRPYEVGHCELDMMHTTGSDHGTTVHGLAVGSLSGR